ncbi:MAG: hypothetical protein M5R42_12340 [Rhodocyclaceae bacterium]|nr:hypothetical protein [Rhodocyclaceae bacterium]
MARLLHRTAPCLADLIALGRTEEVTARYDEYDRSGSDAVLSVCYRVRSWIEMPRLGARIYLTADAGPIYDESGKLVAVVETLRDMRRAEGSRGRARAPRHTRRPHQRGQPAQLRRNPQHRVAPRHARSAAPFRCS